jgi:hypothetical protein
LPLPSLVRVLFRCERPEREPLSVPSP